MFIARDIQIIGRIDLFRQNISYLESVETALKITHRCLHSTYQKATQKSAPAVKTSAPMKRNIRVITKQMLFVARKYSVNADTLGSVLLCSVSLTILLFLSGLSKISVKET